MKFENFLRAQFNANELTPDVSELQYYSNITFILQKD